MIEEGKDTSDFSKPYFAPGSEAENARGVLYQGEYQNEADGTGVAVRLHARALADQGVPLLLKPFSRLVLTPKGVYEPMHVVGIPESVRKEIGDTGKGDGLANTSISKCFPTIKHFVAHKAENISKRLMRGAVGSLDRPDIVMKARKAIYSGTVFFSVWERDRIDGAMVRELNRMGDNWVPCEQNAEMLRSCGVKNVAVIPHPFDPKNPLCKLTLRKKGSTRRFYNIGRWEPRKNQKALLWAFFGSRSPGCSDHLTLKFHGSWEGYQTPDEILDDICEGTSWTREEMAKSLTLIDKQLRVDQILKLHYENNIYVAPSSGEAWCLPAFEAKVAGNTVIHTPYGGTADFCDDSDIALEFEMVDVPASYGWTPGSQWARPLPSFLAKALNEVKIPEHSRSKEFEEKFNMEHVGALMHSRLREMFGHLEPGEYLK